MDDITESPVIEAAPPVKSPSATEGRRPAGALECALAGLQTGMLGAIAMLAWLSFDSSLDRRGFWSEENLFASLFYRGDAVRGGFGAKTLAGIAVYLIVYSLLGAIFAFALGNRYGRRRTVLLALVFALGWYYLSFHLLWKTAMPLVYLLYADGPMLIGHIIYGACLAAFPACLAGRKRPPTVPEAPADEPGSGPEASQSEVISPVESLPPSSE
jgi:hypothetical protein